MIPGLEWMGLKHGCSGKIGVTVFFVLSGFILAYAYGERDWGRQFGTAAREFWRSRFARIYPLHWLMFLAALPLGLNSHSARVSVHEFPWLLTLTERLWPGYAAGAQPDKAAWTLSVEVLFYLLAPLLFLILCRRKQPLAAAASLLVGGTALATTAALVFPTLNWTGYIRLPEFLLGITGFHLSRRVNLSRFAPGLMVAGVTALIAGAVGESLFEWPFYFFGYAPGALLVILGCGGVSGRTERVLSHPMLVLLGNASYSLYLFHDPVLRYTKVILDRAGMVLPAPWNVLAGAFLFAATIAGSVLCYKVYEHPARVRLRALFQRRTKPAPQSGEVLAATPPLG